MVFGNCLWRWIVIRFNKGELGGSRMRKGKMGQARGRQLVAVFSLMLLCGGCGSVLPELSATEPAAPVASVSPTLAPTEEREKTPEEAYEEDPAAFVRFTRSTEPRESYVPVRDIMEYESRYPDCNGTWFRDRLSGEDLCMYNAYLYAMENCCTGFELYVQDNDKDFYYIREAVCLDSPFLEQNLNRYGEGIIRWPTNYIGERVYFRVEPFAESRWEMKMEALERCREIVEGIPEECVTQLEKMEYLYRYVCDHVEYVSYENMADESYLYDAVCKGETVCDGYSNMLNLLFNLIGVECCEVMGSDIEDISQATPEELENAEGHTWVAAQIDGVFYNFDPTYEDGADGFSAGKLLFFGFSDELTPVKYLDRDDARPKCTDTSRDFSYADTIVENVEDDGQIQEIAQLTDARCRNGQYVTMIAIRDVVPDSEFDSFMDRYMASVYESNRAESTILNVGDYTILEIKTEAW